MYAAKDFSPVVMVVTCKGRLVHLQETIKSKLALRGVDKIVIVDYDDPSDSFTWASKLNDPRIVAVKVSDRPFYHHCKARNIGLRVAIDYLKAQGILLTDADVGFNCYFVEHCIDVLVGHPHEICVIGNCRNKFCGGGGTVFSSAQLVKDVHGNQELMESCWGADDTDLKRRMEHHAKETRGYPHPCPEYLGEMLNVIGHSSSARTRHYKIAAMGEGERRNTKIALAWQKEHGWVANPDGWGCCVGLLNEGGKTFDLKIIKDYLCLTPVSSD